MSENLITFTNVSRFYGEVLGVNKVSSPFRPASPAWSVPTAAAKPR